jgi:hypothetical protein
MAKDIAERNRGRFSRIARKLGSTVICSFLIGPIVLISGCNSERPAAEPQLHSESGTVVLDGHLSRDTVPEHEALRFWITVENRTGVSLDNLRIAELDTPGFEKIRGCWGADAEAKGCANTSAAGALPPQASHSSCAPANDSKAEGPDEWLLCRSLKPGESIAAWGDLSVRDTSFPPERLYAVVSWEEPPDTPADVKGKAASGTNGRNLPPPPGGSPSSEISSRVVLLGTAEPVSGFHSFTWLTRPEISISAAIAILGLFLNWLTSRRDERSKVFTAMLGAVHDAAIHFFMPMCSTLSTAMFYIRKARLDAAPGENARFGFYYLTMFHWWQRRVLNKVGAYQLKSRTGEKLLFALSSKHRELYPRTTEAAWRRFDVILSDLQKETTVDEFLVTLDGGDPDWIGAWNDFAAWVKTDNCKSDLNYLDAFTQIMLYEVNGLHEVWYGTRSPMKLSDEAKEAIRNIAKGELDPEAEDYLQKAERN